MRAVVMQVCMYVFVYAYTYVYQHQACMRLCREFSAYFDVVFAVSHVNIHNMYVYMCIQHRWKTKLQNTDMYYYKMQDACVHLCKQFAVDFDLIICEALLQEFMHNHYHFVG
jgi:hypothetical protein